MINVFHASGGNMMKNTSKSKGVEKVTLNCYKKCFKFSTNNLLLYWDFGFEFLHLLIAEWLLQTTIKIILKKTKDTSLRWSI